MPAERLERWSGKWSAGQLGWHLQEVHPKLKKYLSDLVPSPADPKGGMGSRVLFPLCGKTVDMTFLAQRGFRVLGVDGIFSAIEEFAKEQSELGTPFPVQLPPAIDPTKFRAHAVIVSPAAGLNSDEEPPPPVILVEGDFLALGDSEAEALLPFDAAFDRGSLVAVEPKDRREYAQALTGLIAPGGRVLLIATEHDAFADGRLGPPFEVLESDVRTLFEASFAVRQLHRADIEDFRERGCTRAAEAVYLLTRRAAPPKL